MKDSLLDLSIRIYGQKDKLKYTIKSNLDQMMAARLKKELDQLRLDNRSLEEKLKGKTGSKKVLKEELGTPAQ